MASKRERVAHLLDRSGAVRAILWLRSRVPTSRLTVLTYHRIADPAQARRFDHAVVDATPEQFDRQLEFLGAHFRIIGIDEILEHVRGAPLPPNSVLITFDDGYRDCHEVALPILERHRARAVFFISTSYVEQRRMYWWDRIAYVLGRSHRERILIEYPERRELTVDGTGGRAVKDLLALVKRHRELDLDRFLAEMTRAAGVDWDPDLERELADELIMTWDQIADLARAGMDVQSHTRTHRVLHTLATGELAQELEGSRRDIEDHVGTRVRALAYPVGHPISRRQEIVDAVRAAGYQLGFSNASGPNRARTQIDPFDVRRLAMDVTMSDEMFHSVMAIPSMARKKAYHSH